MLGEIREQSFPHACELRGRSQEIVDKVEADLVYRGAANLCPTSLLDHYLYVGVARDISQRYEDLADLGGGLQSKGSCLKNIFVNFNIFVNIKKNLD
jgi:hypothetical protein